MTQYIDPDALEQTALEESDSAYLARMHAGSAPSLLRSLLGNSGLLLLRKLFPWFLCGLGGLFYCYEYLLRVSPSVMNQQIIRHFHTNAAGFGVLASSYYYIYAIMQLFVGILIDTYGPRLLMSLACLSCAAGITLFAATSNYTIAILARLLIGFGSAFAFVGVMKLAATWLPQRYFSLISGITTTLGMLGGILGDIVLTSIINHAGWRWACFYAGIFGVILAFALLFSIQRARASYLKRYMPKQLPSLQHNFKQVLHLLANKHLWLNGVIAGCLYMSLPVFADSWGIPYLTQTLHFSHMTAALMCSAIYMGWAIGAPISGWITESLQTRRKLLMLGSMLSLVVVCCLLYLPHLSAAAVFIFCFLLGLFSSVEVINFAVARDMTSVRYTGSAVAITNMLLMISGWFVALIGFILQRLTPAAKLGEVVYYTPLQFQLALLILPLTLLLACVLLWRFPETYPSHESS